MTIVQFGLAWLGDKTEQTKELVKSLVIIAHDAKKNDISTQVVFDFIKSVRAAASRIPDPRILIGLWFKYKHIGKLTPCAFEHSQ